MNCQTPDLGQGLEFDFTFANNKKNNENNDKKNNPHLNFQWSNGTMASPKVSVKERYYG